MARIRTIKPELPASRDIAKCSIEARYLFYALLCQFDDEGRLDYSAKQLAGVLFPYDEKVSAEDIEKWVLELCEATLLAMYLEDGHKVLCSPTFNLHQVINRPQSSKLPAFRKESSQIIHGVITERSRKTHPRNREQGTGKGKERNRDQGRAMTPPSVEDVRAYALEAFQVNSTFAEDFVRDNTAREWKDRTGKPYQNWKLLVGTWVKNFKPDEAAKYKIKPKPDNSLVSR